MNLVPLPRKTTPTKGTVTLDAWRLDAPKDVASLACLEDLTFLKARAEKTLALRVQDAAVPVRGGEDESYRLDCAPERITLSAATGAGLIRGVQTLRQLAAGGPFGACDIEDAPALGLRAFHIDFRPKSYRVDYLLETIDRLAALKYNALLVEWENKFPYARRPEVVHAEALSASDIARIKQRCEKYAIEIIPLVQTFGHLQFALCPEKNAPLREVPDDSSEICPLKPDAVALVKDLVQDVIDGHPESRFVHLGADETYVLGSCDACKANIEKVGRSAHFINHMKAIAEVVLASGKTPIMWNDMLIRHPEAIDLLPKEMVMLDWHYHTGGVWADEVDAWQHAGPFTAETLKDAPEVFRREFAPFVAGRHPSDARKLRSFPYIKYFMARGFPVIAGPSSCCYRDPGTNPNIHERVPNTWGFAASAAEDGALGIVLTSWQVRRHPWEVQWYPICLCAETAWHPFEGIRDGFDRRFMASQYGLDDAAVPNAFYLLDRPNWEDRCDHYGRTFDNTTRRWCEPPIADWLAEKDAKGELKDKAPQTAKAETMLAHAAVAKRMFDAFAEGATRAGRDAAFWQLAAEETAFRVRLFRVLREVYFARKASSSPLPPGEGEALAALPPGEGEALAASSSPLPPGEGRVRGGEEESHRLAGAVARIVAEGDALYARAENLWAELLPPQTLAEEMLTRWGEAKAYLAGEPPS